MADLYGLEASGLPEELVARLIGTRGKQKIAEAMLAQAMGGIENAGGPNAPLHWTQGAAQMLKAALGRRGIDAAESERTAIGREAEAGREAAGAEYLRNKMGAPGVTPLTPNDDEGNAMPSSPAVPGDPRGAIVKAQMNKFLANSPFLKMEQAALDKSDAREDQQKFLESQAREARAGRAEEQAARLEQRRSEIESQLQNRALDRESRERMAMQQQQIMRELGMARAEAAKAAAEARGDAKAQTQAAKDAKVNEAKGNVSAMLGELGGKFETLNTMGAAVNADKSGPQNAITSIRASAPGQVLGGVFGTKEQVVRDEVKQYKPMLMNAIRQATAQGARGLDSNKELDFYLQAVTDEKKSIQYNRAALKVLEKAYGLGTGVKGVSDADEAALKAEWKKQSAPAGGPPQGVNEAVWNAMTPEEKALWN